MHAVLRRQGRRRPFLAAPVQTRAVQSPPEPLPRERTHVLHVVIVRVDLHDIVDDLPGPVTRWTNLESYAPLDSFAKFASITYTQVTVSVHLTRPEEAQDVVVVRPVVQEPEAAVEVDLRLGMCRRLEVEVGPYSGLGIV